MHSLPLLLCRRFLQLRPCLERAAASPARAVGGRAGKQRHGTSCLRSQRQQRPPSTLRPPAPALAVACVSGCSAGCVGIAAVDALTGAGGDGASAIPGWGGSAAMGMAARAKVVSAPSAQYRLWAPAAAALGDAQLPRLRGGGRCDGRPVGGALT